MRIGWVETDGAIRGNQASSFHAHKQSTISSTTVPSNPPKQQRTPFFSALPDPSLPRPSSHPPTEPHSAVSMEAVLPVRASNWCSAKCWTPLPLASGPSQLSHALISYPLAIEYYDRRPRECLSPSVYVSCCLRLPRISSRLSSYRSSAHTNTMFT